MPVLNLKSFNTAIAAATTELPAEQVKLVQKKLAMDLLRGVMEKSLVDTGLSRGNWHVSIGSPSDALKGLQNEAAVTAAAAAGLEALGDFDVVYLNNNVHYVSYLENGTPRIPAVAMVARTLAELESTLL